MPFINNVSQFLDKIANLTLIRAIRNGLALMIPVIMVGSFAVMINNLPIPAFQEFMTALFGNNWKEIGGFLFKGTYSVMSVCILLSVSYAIAMDSPALREERVNIIITCVMSFCCLIILTEPMENGLGIPFFWTAATGLFVALLTAIVATTLFIKLSNINFLRINAFNHELDSSLNRAIVALVPAFLTLLFFAAIKATFTYFGYADIHLIVYDAVKELFVNMQNDLTTALLFNIFTHLFWFLGIHGTNILEPVALELYTTAQDANSLNAIYGLAPTEIFTKPFFDVFVFIGGCGTTLCLVFAILLAARKSNLTKIAKMSILPAIFNINEVIVFGLPLVFNPYYMIPFFLVPCILTLTTYLAMSWELVPLTINKTIWTTPIIIGGYMTVDSYSGVILQLFNLSIGTAIYYPFVRIAEEKRIQRDKMLLREFYDEVFALEDRKVPVLLTRSDTAGSIARSIAQDIQRDLVDDIFVMQYQPQVDNEGKVCGAEALLRWPHRAYGMVPPPVTVTIAEEANLMQYLGDMIIRKVFKQVGEWQKNDKMKDLVIALNISASQMQNERIIDVLSTALKENDVDPKLIEIELTEGRLLNNSAQSWHMLEQFRDMGFKFAIDDFGMGHNSMRYLREFKVDAIKLDGSLTTEVLHDKNSRDIIASIVQLANNLDLNIIAEFVETKEQMLVLQELGCKQYQGYYYAPALPSEKFEEFVIDMNK